jgi:hypothetical protein
MTYERRTITRTEADPVVDPTPRTSSIVERTEVEPSGGEMLRRGVVFIFGIIQLLIVMRVALLLLNAREGNDLVAFILNTSQLFVAPFVGILNNDAMRSNGSVLDVAAIVALAGWSVLELVILWAVGLVRREPA